ncbi:MAG: tetratricopeptide repeat protein [Flavobacteriales bacterium]|nr:tetratricopeptide repeat protein [Flavobacteriales bacterium]
MKLRSIHIFFIFTLITLIIYSKSVNYDFLNYDDMRFIIGNEWLFLEKQDVKELLTEQKEGHYHPLTWLSLGIQKKTFGLNAGAFQIVNFCLFGLISILVFITSIKLFKRKSIALISTLIFIIHPIHVESIVWKSAHSTLVYSLFFFLSINSYLNYVAQGKTKSLIFTFIFFVLSCMSKSAAIVLPVVLIAIDYFKNNVTLKGVITKVPMLVVSLIFGLLAIKSSREFGSYNIDKQVYDILDRFFIINRAVFYYIEKSFVPFNLSAIHFNPKLTNGYLPTFFYVTPLLNILTIGCSYFIFKRFNRLKDLWFIILFFIINIGMVSQIIPIGDTIAADRFGFIAILSNFWLIAICVDRIELNASLKGKIVTRTSLFFLIAIFLFQTNNRINIWANGEKLFADIAEKYPNHYYGHFALAVVLQAENRGTEALVHFKIADEINPTDAKVKNGLGVTYVMLGNNDLAKDYYSQAILLDKDYVDAYINRSYVYKDEEEYELAAKDLSTAYGLGTKRHLVLINRAEVRYKLKNYHGSIMDCKELISIHNDNHKAWFQAAVIYERLEQYDSSYFYIDRAIHLQPQKIDYLNFKGLLCNKEEKFDEAITLFSKVIQLDSTHIAFMNRGLSKKNLFLYEDAANDFTHCINLSPVFAQAYFERGFCYNQLGKYEQAILDLNFFLGKDYRNEKALNLRAESKWAIGDEAAACSDWSKARNQERIKAHCLSYQ